MFRDQPNVCRELVFSANSSDSQPTFIEHPQPEQGTVIQCGVGPYPEEAGRYPRRVYAGKTSESWKMLG